jgi:hypothetical protein
MFIMFDGSCPAAEIFIRKGPVNGRDPCFVGMNARRAILMSEQTDL